MGVSNHQVAAIADRPAQRDLHRAIRITAAVVELKVLAGQATGNAVVDQPIALPAFHDMNARHRMSIPLLLPFRTHRLKVWLLDRLWVRKRCNGERRYGASQNVKTLLILAQCNER